MFASQLSRILQTLPADVNYDTCAFDSTEEKTSMKENQPEIICISDGKEVDLFSFGKKGIFDSNGFVGDRDEFSKVQDLDCDALEGLQAKDDHQNGLFRFIAQNTGEETLASDTKDSDRYLCPDKNVIEHELPELIVCYQESDYFPVRDICVDKDDHSGTCVSLRCFGDKNNSDLRDQTIQDANECTNKEGEDTTTTTTTTTTTLPVHAANDAFLEDLVKLFGSKCPANEKLVNDMSTTDESTRTVSLEVLEPETEPCHREGNPEVLEPETEPCHKEENSDKTLAMPNSEEDKAKANPLITSQDQYADGEASFAALGSITYSGPIPYSGSISLRSDSSTTSARSFAFPVLQSEWNSSPVKMKKADRRLQKHRGWRQGLLCCRF